MGIRFFRQAARVERGVRLSGRLNGSIIERKEKKYNTQNEKVRERSKRRDVVEREKGVLEKD
jgi:hypothetical protein